MGIDNSQVTSIGTGTLLQVFLRSFFIQGSFSAKYRQNIGIAFCLEPVGKLLWHTPDDYRRFVARQSEHYNGNPFMVTLVLGSVAHMEQQLRNGENVSEDDIRRFKSVAGAATGSTGDRLFWSNLRPTTILAGICVAMSFGFWGVLVFLALYNGTVWFLRLRWLFAGYRLGPKVVMEIKNETVDRATERLESVGCLLAGFTSAALVTLFQRNDPAPIILYSGSVVFFLCAVYLIRRNIPLHIVFTIISIFAVVAGFLRYITG
jgi:mannose PTS system EIID component